MSKKRNLIKELSAWMAKTGFSYSRVATSMPGEVNPATIRRILDGQTKNPRPILVQSLWDLIDNKTKEKAV